MHRSVPELWRATSRDMADRIMHNDQGGQYETKKNRQRASERGQKVPLRPAGLSEDVGSVRLCGDSGDSRASPARS